MNKIGFGFLRLPRLDEKDVTSTDYVLLNKCVDEYIALGGNYFDTAYTYLGGESETAIRKAVVERYDREKIRITTKLPVWKLKSREDIDRYFNEQCEKCGVEYFDTYLLHWMTERTFEKAEKFDVFGRIKELKAEGKVKKIGFLFHDKPEILEKILSAHPDVDYVQLQINYLDWTSSSINSEKCYEIAKKYNRQIIVMSPVKGGTLSEIPEEAKELFEKEYPSMSPSALALLFAQSLDNVELVLSGMNTVEQVRENMRDFVKINDTEVFDKAREIINKYTTIPCTRCGYCVADCPQNINIPETFKLFNEYKINPEEDWKIIPIYDKLVSEYSGASQCILCKKCETNCPQKIEITKWLEEVKTVFGK